MPVTVGTTTLNAPIQAGSRLVAWSDIDGTGKWYVVYQDGANLRSKTSVDGASWSDESTDIDDGDNTFAEIRGKLLAAQSVNPGTLHLMFGINSGSGAFFYQQRSPSAWFGTGKVIVNGFQPGLGTIYENGGSIYVRPLGLGGKFLYSAQDPISSTSFTNTDDFSGTFSATHFYDIDVIGTDVVCVMFSNAATPQILTFVGAGNDTTGTSFPTPTAQYSSANLVGTKGCCAVDGNGLMHILKFVTGTGWVEDTFDGTTYTAGSGAISVMGSSDEYPGMMWDGTNLNLFWCKHNASNDYGIGWATSSGNGTWTAQTDVVAANGANRTHLQVPLRSNGSEVCLYWRQGTGSPWNIVSEIVPFVTLTRQQEGFRWRADDGDEDGATWLDSQDTDITRAKDTVTRLRVLTNVTDDPPSEALKLQYRKVGDPTWKDLDRG